MTEAARHVRTFSGRTMAEALERVREALGPGAAIVMARRVRGRSWWRGRTYTYEVVAGAPNDAPPAASPLDRTSRDIRTPGGSRPSQGPASLPSLSNEVAELRGKVDALLRRDVCGEREEPPATAGKPEACAPGRVAHLRSALEAQGLPEELVTGLVQRVVTAIGNRQGDSAADGGRARSALLRLLERLMPTAGPVRVVSGRCTRVALIGPTGVGKTTTIAKLAAHFKVREERAVGFVAADTYRIAAVEQLRRYAELLGAPVRVVRSPDEVARAVAALSGHDLVFIDTAGRSHRNERRMDELERYLDAARPDEVHLVLSLTSERRALFSAIDRFAPVAGRHAGGGLRRAQTSASSVEPSSRAREEALGRPPAGPSPRPSGFGRAGGRLILSKLDEAETSGAVLQATARAGLRVSYVTTGQEVPDDIEVADSATLARLVLDGPEEGLRRCRALSASQDGGRARARRLAS